ncbi:MazG-like family protein [Lagierella sp. ICN-221743]
MQELITKIEQWAIDRELDKKATVEAQSIKTAEEMAELIIGISKDNVDLIKDSVGDVFVTLVIGNMIDEKHDLQKILSRTKNIEYEGEKSGLISLISTSLMSTIGMSYDSRVILGTIRKLKMVCKFYNLDFTDCVQSAYDEIKDRKGKTIDGQFIKESDL